MRVQVGDLRASYYGTQNLTTNNHGKECYGGSDLVIVRGEYGRLLELVLPEDVRQSVT